MFRTISVIIVDRHPLFRDTLAAGMMGEGFAVLATCGEEERGPELVAEHRPDVCVLDVARPGVDGPRLIRRMTHAGTGTSRVLILSDTGDGALVHAAIAAGAGGFLTKDTDWAGVAQAVRAIATGRAVLGPGLADGLFARIRSNATAATPQITEREHQVLVLAAAGRTVSEMGQELYLSAGTVKTHLAHVYGKLGVSDRGAAVAEAIRRELIA